MNRFSRLLVSAGIVSSGVLVAGIALPMAASASTLPSSWGGYAPFAGDCTCGTSAYGFNQVIAEPLVAPPLITQPYTYPFINGYWAGGFGGFNSFGGHHFGHHRGHHFGHPRGHGGHWGGMGHHGRR